MQQQYYDLFIRGTEYETKFRTQAEGQRRLDDIAALRRTLWEMRAILCHLEDALEEQADIEVEVSCLREQIESAAHRLALQLQTAKEDRT